MQKKKKKRLSTSSYLSVRPHGTTMLPLDGFSWNLTFEYFSKNLWRKFKFHYNVSRIKGTSHADQYTFLIISLSFLPGMRNVLDESCTENQNTHFVFSNVPFFRKSCRFWDNVGKHFRDREATDDNMVHAHCMLLTQGYKHTEIHVFHPEVLVKQYMD